MTESYCGWSLMPKEWCACATCNDKPSVPTLPSFPAAPETMRLHEVAEPVPETGQEHEEKICWLAYAGVDCTKCPQHPTGKRAYE